MPGSMRERSPGVWEVRYQAGRDPVTGRRRQLSKTVKGSKKEASRVLYALVVEADVGRTASDSATYKQLAERWLNLSARNLSATTERTYRNLLEKRIYPAIGDRKISRIKTEELDDLYLGLTRRLGLSSSTVRQIHAIIRRSMRQAVMWGWIATNPATNATPPRQVKSKITPPDPKEVTELLQLAHQRDAQFGNFLHIAATTGARRGELCALRWEDLDFERAELTINHSIIEVPGGLRMKDTKTHISRRIAVGEATIEVFRAQLRIAEEQATLLGQGVQEDGYIFSHELDGSIAWTPSNVTKKFSDLRAALGYHEMRLHDLRHFAATQMMAGGIPVRTISGRLGHANAATTLSVYSHFVEASDQVAAGFMDGKIAATKPSLDTQPRTNEKLSKSTSTRNRS